MTICCCTARSIKAHDEEGLCWGQAVGEAVDDMRALRGGLISRVTVHAIDTKEIYKVAAVEWCRRQQRDWLWEGQGAPTCCRPSQWSSLTSATAPPTATTRYTRR